jgi:hypothetical protein
MLFLRPFLLTVLVPLLTSGILYFIFRNFIPKLAAPLAITLGYLAAYVAVAPGLPNFPPLEFKDYIFYLAVFGLWWVGLESLWSKNTLLLWVLRTLALLGILSLVLRNRLRAWETWEIILWFGGITLILLVAWGVLERLTDSDSLAALPPAALYTALTLLIAGSSITTVTSGSASLGQLGGALAASVGALTLVSWFLKVEVTSYLGTVLIFLIGVLWFGGSVFAKVPPLSATILALSSLVLLLVQTNNTLRGNLTRLVLFALPILLVTGYAIWQFILDTRQPAF